MLYIKQLTLKHTVNKVLQKQVLNIQTLFKPTNDIAFSSSIEQVNKLVKCD